MDAREPGMLMRLALKNREVDDRERSVIFARITRDKVTTQV